MDEELQGMRQLMDSLGVLNCQLHHIMWVMRYLARKGHGLEKYEVLLDEGYSMSCTQVTLVRAIASMERDREIRMNTEIIEQRKMEAQADEDGAGVGGGGDLSMFVPFSTERPEQAREFMMALAVANEADFESIMNTPLGLG